MSDFIPVAEVAQALDLTERQVIKDIAAGRIPGFFRYTGKRNRKPYILRHEWNQYLRGEWRSSSNVSFLHKRNAVAS